MSDTLGRLAIPDEELDCPEGDRLLDGEPSGRRAATKPSTCRLVLMLSYIGGWAATWVTLLVVVLPAHVLKIVGDAHKGRGISTLLLFGAIISTIVPPVIGFLSDRTHTRFGPRKPYIGWGVIGCALTLLFMSTAESMWLLVPAFMLLQLFSNIAMTAFFAVIPDTVGAEGAGSASGLMGGMAIIGNTAGAAIGSQLPKLGFFNVYALLAVMQVVFAALSLSFMDNKPRFGEVDEFGGMADFKLFMRTFWAPMRNADFRWVFTTRFLFQMGIYTVQEYLEYFLKDVIALPKGVTAESAVSLMFIPLIIGSLLTVLSVGWLSDRWGRRRKPFVAASGVLMSIVCLMFPLTTSFRLLLGEAFLFGLAFGTFQAIDFALVCDVLPSKTDAAKDMGVWHISLVLPQVVAVPMAGGILDYFKPIGEAQGNSALPYLLIFLLALLYFLLATVLLRKIRGVR
eukprot:PLAT7543.1.p1 GENE.PLAT7543.1~~PLAT7543.1.p1  ORF type:complete len:470 (+),score=144.85 PLAT7543.1:48-1412(+)